MKTYKIRVWNDKTDKYEVLFVEADNLNEAWNKAKEKCSLHKELTPQQIYPTYRTYRTHVFKKR